MKGALLFLAALVMSISLFTQSKSLLHRLSTRSAWKGSRTALAGLTPLRELTVAAVNRPRHDRGYMRVTPLCKVAVTSAGRRHSFGLPRFFALAQRLRRLPLLALGNSCRFLLMLLPGMKC